jgi:hypothetical protein
MLKWAILGLMYVAALCAGLAQAQPMPDTHADVSVAHPAFARDQGPKVLIDAGHHNFHTADGLFAPFARLLSNDGFNVAASAAAFTAGSLANTDVLVIANALSASNVDRWELPTPSAFTAQEVAALVSWVRDGGALLLIADHLPFAGAAGDLAAAFGFTFVNSFVLNSAGNTDPDVFSVASGALVPGVVTRGRNPAESVPSVTTFTGSALHAPKEAQAVLTLSAQFVVLLPKVAWQFDASTPRFSGSGWLQGAVMRSGKGRIAVFGEAAMFTAQVTKEDAGVRLGFNSALAPHNKQFVLNLLHWLCQRAPHVSTD